MKKYLRKIAKITAIIIASFILLLILLALAINIPFVQNFAKNKVISYLQKKTATEIRLERINIGIPRDLSLKNFYIADKKHDTLLFAEKLAVDIDMLKLLKNNVEIQDILLKNVRAKIYRNNPDTVFNFQFLIDSLSGNQKKPQHTNEPSAPLKLNISKISFENIRANYKDDVAGNEGNVFIDRFNTKIETFDLNNLHFKIKTLDLSNTNFTYNQKKPLTVLQQVAEASVDETKNASGGKLPFIEFDKLTLKKVNLAYDDRLSDTRANADLNDFSFTNLQLNLSQGGYRAEKGYIANSTIDVAYRPTPPNEQALEKTNENIKKSAFSLLLTHILFKNNHIKFRNLSSPQATKGKFSANDMEIKDFTLEGNHIAVIDKNVKADIANLKLEEKSGFVVNDLKAKLVYDDKQTMLHNFFLKTPKSTVKNNTTLSYSNIEDLSKHPEKVKVNSKFDNAVIHVSDLNYFTNSIPATFRNESIKLNTELSGRLNYIIIPYLQLSALRNTNVNISGNIKGLPDMQQAFFDIRIHHLRTTKRDLQAFIPKKSLPDSITLPNYISISGDFKGGLKRFSTTLNTATDLGIVNVNGTFDMTKKGKEHYKADLGLLAFDAGKLLRKQDVLGKVSLNMHVDGSGISKETANAKFDGKVIALHYNGYNYKDVDISGAFANQSLHIITKSDDPNVTLNLNANIDLSGKAPAIKGTVDLSQIDLQKLNFSKTDISLGGVIKMDFTSLNPDSLNGNATITNLQIVKDKQHIALSPISINATSTELNNTLKINSEILNADIEGKYSVSQIGQAFINIINKYYAFGKVKPIPHQHISFDITIFNSNVLHKLVPDINTFEKSTIKGLLDTRTHQLNLASEFPLISYKDYRLEKMNLGINNKDTSKLDYVLSFKALESPSIQFYTSEVKGNAANNLLDVNVLLRDSNKKDKYVLGGIFKTLNQTSQFSIDPNKLVLNYDKWNVAPDNLFQYGKAGIFVQNFLISNRGQSLSVTSLSNEANSPVRATFKFFKLESLTKFAEKDSTLLGGLVNGTVDVTELMKSPKFVADLNILRLRYQKDNLGNVKINANNKPEHGYEINTELSGVHQAKIKGFFYTFPANRVDMQLTLDKIDIKNIQSLTQNQIQYGKGTIKGNINAEGFLSAPDIDGKIKFEDVGLNVKQLNAYFSFKNEEINFKGDGIHFNNFTILDTLNHKAVINGRIYTLNYNDFAWNVTAKADNFNVMNSTEADNKLFYGKLFIDLNSDIKGDINKPKVTAFTRIAENSKFNFVIPQNDPTVVEQKGVVEFVDMNKAPHSGRKALSIDTTTRSPIKGVELSGNLSIDKNAEITIVVDPENGDALKVKGQGDLSVQMDPSGKITFTGRYEFSEGNYRLSIGGFQRKDFKIQQGSSIQWTGAPTEANVDLKAVYEVNTSSIDLIADVIQGDEISRNMYKQKLPFLVYLIMKGELLKPSISFQLDMPERERNALQSLPYKRIQQLNTNESELNKQVFSLLAFNRFMPNDPFNSLNDNNLFLDPLRQSASRLLTNQLNRIASDLVKGVDINFDANIGEDYSSGKAETQADLNMAVSKRLFNDRFIISVGNSFEVAGAKAGTSKAVGLANNVNVEYLLSKDGRYRLRAYRRNQSEGIIEGEIIETGVGFMMIVDYNQFAEIFESFRKRNKNPNL